MNEQVLADVNETIVRRRTKKKKNWMGHVARVKGLLKHNDNEKI